MGRVKDMILFNCEECGNAVLDDDVGFDGENNLCPACVDKWTAEQIIHWRPLYKGEVAAGLHDPKTGADFDTRVKRTHELFSILEKMELELMKKKDGNDA